MKEKIETYCGLSCESCEFRVSMNCGGCIATQGKPFHGKCDVAECAVSKKRGFCAECAEFPCELLKSYSYDTEHGDNGARIERCAALKRALVAEAREGLDEFAYCGFSCNHCMYTPYCGGCRSNYNGCSFATLYEDGRCPNEKCCNEKGHYGCWECPELDECEIGFFSKKEEFLAKAGAMFLRKHGREAAMRMLEKSKEKFGDSPDPFNQAGSTEAALKLMESFL